MRWKLRTGGTKHVRRRLRLPRTYVIKRRAKKGECFGDVGRVQRYRYRLPLVPDRLVYVQLKSFADLSRDRTTRAAHAMISHLNAGTALTAVPDTQLAAAHWMRCYGTK